MDAKRCSAAVAAAFGEPGATHPGKSQGEKEAATWASCPLGSEPILTLALPDCVSTELKACREVSRQQLPLPDESSPERVRCGWCNGQEGKGTWCQRGSVEGSREVTTRARAVPSYDRVMWAAV